MFTDAQGTQHRVAPQNARIVSLVPSLTELLFDLGLASQVIGRTEFCIHPHADVKKIKSVGGTKKINFDKLLELKPDYVLLNMDENPKAMAEKLDRLGVNTIITHPLKVADNPGLYTLLGHIFSRQNEALQLQDQFHTAFAKLKHNLNNRPRQQVLYIIWQAPWMTISPETYIADMLRQVNWQVVAPMGETRYPDFQFSDLHLDQIDRVLFSSEPFPFTDNHILDFAKAHPAHADKACLIDGELLSWYGSRAIKALPYLDAFAANQCK